MEIMRRDSTLQRKIASSCLYGEGGFLSTDSYREIPVLCAMNLTIYPNKSWEVLVVKEVGVKAFLAGSNIYIVRSRCRMTENLSRNNTEQREITSPLTLRNVTSLYRIPNFWAVQW